MILYLSSTEHTNLLDFWSQQEDGNQTPVKKMVGNFILKQFVIYDMRNFSHVSEVVLDRIAFGDSDEVFAEAIEEFLTMYQVRVTVIYEGLNPSDSLFQALLDSGVGNLVCNTEIQAIQQEITECLSEDGMERYLVKRHDFVEQEQEHYRFDCENVRIAVLSSQPRMGATTVAIGLCSWLASVGATVSYVEANDSGHLNALIRGYDMEQETGRYYYEGVYYQSKEPLHDTNFVVYDVGSSLTGDMGQMHRADRILIVCGTKPYELQFTMQLIKHVEIKEGFLMLPFVESEVRQEIGSALENNDTKVLFLEYQPELTAGVLNAKPFKTVIKDYIAGA